MLAAQSAWQGDRWKAHMDISSAYLRHCNLLSEHLRHNNIPESEPENKMDQILIWLADSNPNAKADGYEYFRFIIQDFNRQFRGDKAGSISEGDIQEFMDDIMQEEQRLRSSGILPQAHTVDMNAGHKNRM